MYAIDGFVVRSQFVGKQSFFQFRVPILLIELQPEIKDFQIRQMIMNKFRPSVFFFDNDIFRSHECLMIQILDIFEDLS